MTITTTKTWVAMTAVAVPVPASSDGTHPAGRHLVGIGLFLAHYGEKRRWRFRPRTHVIAAGERESCLLERVADRLPADGALIGWNIDHALMPVLLDAAATAQPIVAHYFTGRLYRLLRGGVVDLSLAHGGGGAAPLAAVAEDMAIYAPAWNAGAVFSAWATGLVDPLRRDIADEALALWRVFVRTAGVGGIGAEAATDAWVARRSRQRAVNRAGGAG